MGNSKDEIQKQLTTAEKAIAKNVKKLLLAVDGDLQQQQVGSANSLVEELGVVDQPVVIEGVEIMPPGNKSQALDEIQVATEKQRALRLQYENDRTFFEKNVLSKARGLCEIQEDYIKVLHPHYREKFMDGIRKYGTVAAAMKWMKDNHALKLRGDVLKRIALLIPSFKQEVEDAEQEYQATLHMEMHRRAVEGIDKGVYHQGVLMCTEKQYSDSLLVKMADTHNPEYKEAKEKDKSRGNVVNVQIIKDFHNYKD